MNRLSIACLGLILPTLGAVAWAQPAPAPTAEVRFVIDATRDVKPISRFIYGTNDMGAVTKDTHGLFTSLRIGGNRTTAYNWTNNASNAGSDWHYQNDDFMGGGDTPGGGMMPTLDAAHKAGAACIMTVPMAGYVSFDKRTANVRQNGADYLQKNFRPEVAAKNAPFTLTPDPDAPAVYEDEFVNWVKTKYPYGFTEQGPPIWFMLDNEPDIWSGTHAEIHPKKLTYAELISKTIDYSTAIKNVAPDTLVFGAVNYGYNGMITLQDAPDGGGRDFQTTFLAAMAQAERKAGHRLLDVLDYHWYSEATGGGVRVNEKNDSPAVVAARIQAPRSMWDPKYVETSWITTDHLHGPIHMIPTVLDKIAKNYPNTKLSISEYNFGGAHHISGAIATADALGIFGRYGIFNANEWPLDDKETFIIAAFRMYRDFDGNHGKFGDTSVFARTDDDASTSVYASKDSEHPGTMTVVAINKTDHPIAADLSLQNAPSFSDAQVYVLSGTSPEPRAAGSVQLANAARVNYTLPPMSVTTLRLSGQ